MAVKTYRKTALVTAEQFLPAIGQIPNGVYSDGHGDPRKRPDCNWVLDTKEGRHDVRGGDYICTGPAGEQWNVAKEIFEATYEEVETPSPQTNLKAGDRTVAELPMTAFANAFPQRDEFNGEQTILTYNDKVGVWDLAFFESGEEFPDKWLGDTHWIDITRMWPGVIAQVASFALATEGK